MVGSDMAKENCFLLREAAKAAQAGYYDHISAGGAGDPAEERWIDALIAGSNAIAQVAALEKRIAQTELERDAAVYDMLHVAPVELCMACEHSKKPAPCEKYDFRCDECPEECPCKICHQSRLHFKWRGPCPENTEDKTC